MKEQSLFIGDKILSVDMGNKKRKPAIIISLEDRYNKQACDDLLTGLSQMMLSGVFGSKLPIRDLRLTWVQYDEDFKQEAQK